jgi:hypothetical protein
MHFAYDLVFIPELSQHFEGTMLCMDIFAKDLGEMVSENKNKYFLIG